MLLLLVVWGFFGGFLKIIIIIVIYMIQEIEDNITGMTHECDNDFVDPSPHPSNKLSNGLMVLERICKCDVILVHDVKGHNYIMA